MKTVMAFGTFDEFHPGHEFYLTQAKKHGDKLIAIVARDSTVKEVKGKYPQHNEIDRLQNVQNIQYVDKAVLGFKGDKLKIIKEIKPDTICLGYDQNSFDLEKENLRIKIKRIKAFKPNKYKSSLLNKQNGNR